MEQARAIELRKLALEYCDQRRYEEAEDLFAQVVKWAEQTSDTTRIAHALSELGNVCLIQKKKDEALKHRTRALQILEKSPTGRQLEIAMQLRGLSAIKKSQKEYKQAEELIERCLFITERELGRSNLAIIDLLFEHASIIEAEHNFDKSEPILKRVLKICENAPKKGVESKLTLALLTLGFCLEEQNKLTEAEPIYLRYLALEPDSEISSLATCYAQLSELTTQSDVSAVHRLRWRSERLNKLLAKRADPSVSIVG